MTEQLNGKLKEEIKAIPKEKLREIIQSNPKLLKKMKNAKKKSLKELKLAKQYIEGFIDSIEQKYEDLVWYARKPGDLKLSQLLTEDLSLMVPAALFKDEKESAVWLSDNGALSAEQTYLKNPDEYKPLPFDVWAQEGEEVSGFTWPDGGYHKDIVKGALQQLRRVEKENPTECKLLNDLDEGQWQHGFNSGCLAMVRHVRAIIEEDEWTIDNFPFLDT